MVLLAIGRTSAWKAALTALLSACLIAWLVFKMPVAMVFSSVLVGLVFALFRIVWLIVAAVFLYEITVVTGQFEIMKASVARLSGDRRLQAVLVAFCFGAFVFSFSCFRPDTNEYISWTFCSGESVGDTIFASAATIRVSSATTGAPSASVSSGTFKSTRTSTRCGCPR